MKNKISLILTMLLISLVSACGGTGIETQSSNTEPPPPESACVTTPTSFQNAQAYKNLFSLGSDYPADLQFTPDGAALAVLNYNPVSVIFLNPSNPSQLHSDYPIFDASGIAEAASPTQMIFDPDPSRANRGYFLSSTHLIGFDSSTGAHLFSEPLTNPIPLIENLNFSSPCDCLPLGGDGVVEDFVSGSMTPNFPASLAIFGNKLFVSLSNLYLEGWESYYLPGLILAFDLLPEAPYLQPASTPFAILPGYNATAITALSDRLLVTLSGDATFAPGNYTPQTPSFLVELDPETLALGDTLNLGYLAANFRPLAVNADETLAYLGSAAFPQVMEIALSPLQVNGILNLSEAATGFITDQKLLSGGLSGAQVLAASSYNDSTIYGVDLSGSELVGLPGLDFSFPENPGVTGVGPLAVPPSSQAGGNCVYNLYTLTSSPGSVGAVVSH